MIFYALSPCLSRLRQKMSLNAWLMHTVRSAVIKTEGDCCLLTERQVWYLFGGAVAQAGQSMVDAGLVSECRYRPEIYSLDAQVASDNAARSSPYDVSIQFNYRLTKVLLANCNCSTRRSCAHAAAVLLYALSNGLLVDPDAPKLESQAPSFVDEWVRDIIDANTKAKTSLAGAKKRGAPAELDDNDPAQSPMTTLRDRIDKTIILYVLDVASDGFSIKLTLKRGSLCRERDREYYMPDATIDIDRLINDPSSFIDPVDLDVVQLFIATRRRILFNFTQNFGDSTNSRYALERMIATGRCFWRDPSNPPLVMGQPVQGVLVWDQLPHKCQQLKIAVPGVSEDSQILLAGDLWCVDLTESSINPVQVDMDQRYLRRVLTAPVLNLEQARAIATMFGDKRIPLPAPLSDITEETQIVRPRPVVKLSKIDMRSPSFKQSGHIGTMNVQNVGSIDFVYEKLGRELDGNHVIDRKRDKEFEANCLCELERYHLQANRLQWHKDQSPIDIRADKPRDWAIFTGVGMPRLRELGWQFDIDHTFDVSIWTAEDRWIAESNQEASNWFTLNVGITVNDRKISLLPILFQVLDEIEGEDPLAELQRFNVDGDFYAQMDDGDFVKLPFDRVAEIIGELVYFYDREYGPKRPKISITEAQKIARIMRGNKRNHQWVMSQHLSSLLDRFEHLGEINEQTNQQPAGFLADLRPYQSAGLAWLQFIEEQGIGGILADDMGLGKTIQALAHIQDQKNAGRLDRPVLVICPVSVMPNWLREARRFAPDLKTVTYYGTNRHKRLEAYMEPGGADLIVTTYHTLKRDVGNLSRIKLRGVICDESQYIKNAETGFNKAVRALDSHYRVCLTGTPIENNLMDIWSQFHFVMPGYLPGRSLFNKQYRRPIEKQQNMRQMRRLKEKVAPFVLRRTKETVANDLPPKTVIVRTVDLEGAQRDLYETIRLAMYRRVNHEIAHRGLEKSSVYIIEAMLRLRQICCDPRLYMAEHAGMPSSKLDFLMQMLQELLSEGKKILLFSQWTTMLDLIKERIAKLPDPVDYVELRGDTKDRQGVIDAFQSGQVPLFLLSLRAGGAGINLTAADTVIHYDHWWNPAVEHQATDRAHRIGQDKNVFVFKVIATDTIEERLMELHDKKKLLAGGIYESDMSLPSNLSLQDIEMLFGP